MKTRAQIEAWLAVHKFSKVHALRRDEPISEEQVETWFKEINTDPMAVILNGDDDNCQLFRIQEIDIDIEGLLGEVGSGGPKKA
jgi:hypothetical protein